MIDHSMKIDLKQLARYIDISLVRTDVTYEEIETMVDACVKYGFINRHEVCS